MWKIKIHRLVIKEDFKKINNKDQSIILKTIYKKLSIGPKEYGSPLSSNLKGYWKLRVSDYRIIYCVEERCVKVFVLKVGMRRDEQVYKEMIKRIKKM